MFGVPTPSRPHTGQKPEGRAGHASGCRLCATQAMEGFGLFFLTVASREYPRFHNFRCIPGVGESLSSNERALRRQRSLVSSRLGLDCSPRQKDTMAGRDGGKNPLSASFLCASSTGEIQMLSVFKPYTVGAANQFHLKRSEAESLLKPPGGKPSASPPSQRCASLFRSPDLLAPNWKEKEGAVDGDGGLTRTHLLPEATTSAGLMRSHPASCHMFSLRAQSREISMRLVQGGEASCPSL